MCVKKGSLESRTKLSPFLHLVSPHPPSNFCKGSKKIEHNVCIDVASSFFFSTSTFFLSVISRLYDVAALLSCCCFDLRRRWRQPEKRRAIISGKQPGGWLRRYGPRSRVVRVASRLCAKCRGHGYADDAPIAAATAATE